MLPPLVECTTHNRTICDYPVPSLYYTVYYQCLSWADQPNLSIFVKKIGKFRAAELDPLTDAQMKAVRAVYDRYLRDIIHPQW